MTMLTRFGDPSRFEIAVRWIEDREPRMRRPAEGGWSTGELQLNVGGYRLTPHRQDGTSHAAVRWYLLPVFTWLAENWVALLHEERFAWRENSAAPAARATFLALRRMIDAEDSAGQAQYADIQAWWSRHALRAADAGALYPDVLFRRLGDDIEISWTARQPNHAPDGFKFALEPGAATLPVDEVAGPLWQALAWVVDTAAVFDAEDRDSLIRLRQKIDAIGDISTPDLEAAFLPLHVLQPVIEACRKMRLADNGLRMPSVPALTRLDDAVLMFGGVDLDIGASDLQALTGFLAARAGGRDNVALEEHLDFSIGAPLSAPFEEGYALAEEFLEALGLPGEHCTIDVRAILSSLHIEIIEQALRTRTIRGVALAGTHYAPAILINRTSPYNGTEPGRRFTLAHELCHILYDRSRARRIAHTSGPWAPPGVEKRANAFAAMLLMPRELVQRNIPRSDLTQDMVSAAAEAMQVGGSALIEHLFNLDMLDAWKRDELRTFAPR